MPTRRVHDGVVYTAALMGDAPPVELDLFIVDGRGDQGVSKSGAPSCAEAPLEQPCAEEQCTVGQYARGGAIRSHRERLACLYFIDPAYSMHTRSYPAFEPLDQDVHLLAATLGIRRRSA